jgi:hypothetical protein
MARPGTGAAGSSAVSQEEWESKYATVTGLQPAYKACKAEEAAARAELETLQFTLTTVREQRKAVEERINAKERQVGAEGFAQASVLLDKVRMYSHWIHALCIENHIHRGSSDNPVKLTNGRE